MTTSSKADAKVEKKVEEFQAMNEAALQVALGDEGVGSADGEPVFLDRPGGDDAKKVSVKTGQTDTAIWEEVFQNNASNPTYVLRWPAGSIVPENYEDWIRHWTMYDSGPKTSVA